MCKKRKQTPQSVCDSQLPGLRGALAGMSRPSRKFSLKKTTVEIITVGSALFFGE